MSREEFWKEVGEHNDDNLQAEENLRKQIELEKILAKTREFFKREEQRIAYAQEEVQYFPHKRSFLLEPNGSLKLGQLDIEHFFQDFYNL